MKKVNSKKLFWGIRAKVILFMTISLGMLFLVTFMAVNEIARSERFESLTQQNELYNERMQGAFEEIEEELNQLTANFILNDYVQKSLTSQIFTSYDREMMEKSLSYQQESFLDYYLVIDNKGNQFSQTQVEVDMSEFYQSPIFQCLGMEYSKTKLIWTEDIIFGTGKKSFFAVRYIREMNTVHEPGFLILKFNDNIFEKIKESISNEQLAYFVMDEAGSVCLEQYPNVSVCASDNDRQAILEKVMHQMKNYKNQKLRDGILSMRIDESTGFHLITYAPPEISLSSIRQIQIVLAVIFLAGYAGGILITVLYVRKLTKPIKMLSETMISFDEKNLEQQIRLSTNTELDQIGNAYNSMVERVGMLMSDVQKKERELRKSELESLMYQIRPHFLYNTLDTIYMLARISKEETIMRMIQSLSRFLRINLSNGNEEITVEKELEHVGAYLEIQKIRNADLFEYEIICDERVKEYSIMKMILQPVAENCIKYGFKNIYEGGLIKIKAEKYKDELCISVANNGDVIEEIQMTQLNRLEHMVWEEMDSVVQNRQGGYGISNVVRRLRMKYADCVRFYYEQEENWTVCRIHISLKSIGGEGAEK